MGVDQSVWLPSAFASAKETNTLLGLKANNVHMA